MTTTITLPARPFATGWLNAALFASTDKADPIYRAICLSLTEDTQGSVLIFTATNRYASFTCHIADQTLDDGYIDCAHPDDGNVPDPDHAVWSVADLDHRAKALASYIVADTADYDPDVDQLPEVTVTIGRDPQAPPVLSAELDQLVCSIDYEGRERVTIPVINQPIPTSFPTPGNEQMAPGTEQFVHADFLALFAKLKGLDKTAGISLTPTGTRSPIVWSAKSHSAGIDGVGGLIATIRNPNANTGTGDVEPTVEDLEAERSANLDAIVDELDRQGATVEATGTGDLAAALAKSINDAQARRNLSVV